MKEATCLKISVCLQDNNGDCQCIESADSIVRSLGKSKLRRRA